ncbi:hypothetical protein [Bacillus methanolicus]|uniref:Uncharacterized protein n=1 Tax=Bacillus methanolicus (strain MGA3 / ATCC 53907) TaxID=796606 RepID=I3DTH3_BACMM|nr:hypothetical protein [Bacillus methanolicus]AIE61730.1 hypothetical protein BMMGA3_16905 [Bacillus methanolicus MGA3]EIJ77544.1 hypothetical protein MGA3_17642 [Bacillus methanolicus MGA3]
MYRPTVRYADVYKQYVDSLFHATTLDRNQIIRAALFTAAHSKEFLNLMYTNKKKDVNLPSPSWKLEQSELWKEQNPTTREERDVNANCEGKTKVKTNPGTIGRERSEDHKDRRLGQTAGREGEIPFKIRTSGRGIKIRIG